MNGTPDRAREPMIRQEVVVGSAFLSPPIFRMSCSLPRLWMIVPAQRKSIALKNACVEMCINASSGCFNPMEVIIRPS